ncbi:MAG: DUF927 domain-containing protein [Planctomycetota bacterium]|nr:DUF927 domain-containing protein [Planctomycetota bacterium]
MNSASKTTKQQTNSPLKYRETKEGIVYMKPTNGGTVEFLLANFTARIIEQVCERDGTQELRYLTIKTSLDGVEKTFSIPATDLNGTAWCMKHLGARAMIDPGHGNSARLAHAIQTLSGKTYPQRTIFAHTGWTEINGKWSFLHGDGAIHAEGFNRQVEVRMPPELSKYRLPEPLGGDQAAKVVTQSLDLLNVAPENITLPLLATVFRAVAGDSTFSVFLAGQSGTGKTELASLIQQFFGSEMNALNLPANWSSTSNSLEALAYRTKDCLMVVDDFCPIGSQADIQRYHKDADRLLRGQGNNSGRQRMTATSDLQPTKYPRGIIISTGEDIPRGQSLRARLLILETKDGDVDFVKLTELQNHAENGVFAQCMASYLQFRAADYGRFKDRFSKLSSKYRTDFSTEAHKRTADMSGQLLAAMDLFLEFAVQLGSINDSGKESHLSRLEKILCDLTDSQSMHQSDSDPSAKFFPLLSEAIMAGRAHLAAYSAKGEDEVPRNPGNFGWHPNGNGNWC